MLLYKKLLLMTFGTTFVYIKKFNVKFCILYNLVNKVLEIWSLCNLQKPFVLSDILWDTLGYTTTC